MKYSPELHTEAARTEQIGLLYERHPEAIIIGSVGRAAILGNRLPTYTHDFGTLARDIDITTTDGQFPKFSAKDDYPFPADSSLRKLITVDERKGEATVIFNAETPNISVTVDSVIFEPYKSYFEDASISTFHPDTTRQLFATFGRARAKDRKHAQEFSAGLKKIDYKPLDLVLLKPLDELYDMAMRDPLARKKEMYKRLQSIYMRVVPHQARAAISPALQPIKRVARLNGLAEPAKQRLR